MKPRAIWGFYRHCKTNSRDYQWDKDWSKSRNKRKTGEIGSEEIFELYIQDREQERKRKQEVGQNLQKYPIQEQQQEQCWKSNGC